LPGTGGTVEFRALRRADLPTFGKVFLLGVGNLERSTGLDYNAETMVKSLSKWSIWAILRISQWVGRPIVTTFVAAEGTRVVGTGSLLWFPEAGYVAGMATEPEYRGRGIATRILERLQAETARRRRRWLALDVESENEVAIRVYRKAGYREVARFTWYTRTGLADASGPSTERSRAASTAEQSAVAPELDAGRSPEYRTALPASARVLNHNELLVRGVRVRAQTWIRRTASGAPAVLRAFYLSRSRMGVYLPMSGRSELSPADLTPLFRDATEWLRGETAATSLAVVQEPVGGVGQALEGLGFRPVVSSVTMLRPTAG